MIPVTWADLSLYRSYLEPSRNGRQKQSVRTSCCLINQTVHSLLNHQQLLNTTTLEWHHLQALFSDTHWILLLAGINHLLFDHESVLLLRVSGTNQRFIRCLLQGCGLMAWTLCCLASLSMTADSGMVDRSLLNPGGCSPLEASTNSEYRHLLGK